jgi:phage internal scaffolding protein
VNIKRFGLTGQLPTNVRAPQYGDFTGITNYQDALHAVMAAEDSFMAMPAKVRARFHNDPEAFVNFCSDPANIDEAVSLGLAVRKAVEEGTAVPVSDPPTPKPQAKPGKAPAATAE